MAGEPTTNVDESMFRTRQKLLILHDRDVVVGQRTNQLEEIRVTDSLNRSHRTELPLSQSPRLNHYWRTNQPL